MRVNDLSQYGKPLTFPKEVQGRQIGIVFRAIREEFGIMGVLPFLARVVREQRALRRQHPNVIDEARKLGPEVAREMVMLTALFNVAAARLGRGPAYDFLRRLFQRIAVFTMPAIYQIDELVACEGDVFDNFKDFNQAMFEAMDREGTWKSDSIVDEPDRLRIKVVSCANVDLFTAIGAPELAKLGCDHDLAGYPVILDRVDAEFRRPCTLAKGGTYCDFNFYRRGSAPPTEAANR